MSASYPLLHSRLFTLPHHYIVFQLSAAFPLAAVNLSSMRPAFSPHGRSGSMLCCAKAPLQPQPERPPFSHPKVLTQEAQEGGARSFCRTWELQQRDVGVAAFGSRAHLEKQALATVRGCPCRWSL